MRRTCSHCVAVSLAEIIRLDLLLLCRRKKCWMKGKYRSHHQVQHTKWSFRNQNREQWWGGAASVSKSSSDIPASGFHVLYQPYADDVRTLDPQQFPSASQIQVDKMKQIVSKLRFKYR